MPNERPWDPFSPNVAETPATGGMIEHPEPIVAGEPPEVIVPSAQAADFIAHPEQIPSAPQPTADVLADQGLDVPPVTEPEATDG